MNTDTYWLLSGRGFFFSFLCCLIDVVRFSKGFTSVRTTTTRYQSTVVAGPFAFIFTVVKPSVRRPVPIYQRHRRATGGPPTPPRSVPTSRRRSRAEIAAAAAVRSTRFFVTGGPPTIRPPRPFQCTDIFFLLDVLYYTTPIYYYYYYYYHHHFQGGGCDMSREIIDYYPFGGDFFFFSTKIGETTGSNLTPADGNFINCLRPRRIRTKKKRFLYRARFG